MIIDQDSIVQIILSLSRQIRVSQSCSYRIQAFRAFCEFCKGN